MNSNTWLISGTLAVNIIYIHIYMLLTFRNSYQLFQSFACKDRNQYSGVTPSLQTGREAVYQIPTHGFTNQSMCGLMNQS